MAAPRKPNVLPSHRAKRRNAQAAEEAAGTLDLLREKLWRCLNRVEEIMQDESADPLLTLKSVHALTQAAGCYVKLTEAGEFEARLDALEEALTGRRSMASSGAYA